MLAKITVSDYMAKHLLTVKEDTDVIEAISKLLDHKITCAPVLNDQGKLVGMFSEKDCMKVVLDTAYNQGQSGRVGEFMTRDLITVDADSSILDLAQKFRETPLRSFPVYKQGELVGVVSRTDVLKALISIK